MRHKLALVLALSAVLSLTACSGYHGPINNAGCRGGPSSMGRYLGGPDTIC